MHDVVTEVAGLTSYYHNQEHLDIRLLPVLPSDRIEWCKIARPQVEGELRSFLASPFWLDIYNDYHPEIMILNGRQTYKTTYAMDMLLYDTTTKSDVAVAYMTHDDTSLSHTMTQKLRVGAIKTNKLLAAFPKQGRTAGTIGEIGLKNNSVIYGVNDHHEMKHIEGLTLYELLVDECQYTNLKYLPKARPALRVKKGSLKLLGIGGEEGGEWHRTWNSSDQREWYYEESGDYVDHNGRVWQGQAWRYNLKFDQNGLVIGEYLKDVLKGRWTPTQPENAWFHGYHMPQTIFAEIPLTEYDALHNYQFKSPTYSVEWQEKNHPKSYFLAHVMGEFYKAARRPITAEMVRSCMDSRYRLRTIAEIAEIKDKYKNAVKISMGVDWGSGKANGRTFITILILWRKTGIIEVAYIEGRDPEHQLGQAGYVREMFVESKTDIAVADLGYGANQVKIIQDGGSHMDHTWEGVGSQNFIGCRSVGTEEDRDPKFFEERPDEHGDEVSQLQLDKFTAMQDMINIFETHVPFVEDGYPELKPVTVGGRDMIHKFLIPSEDDIRTDFLIKDFTSVVRKDLAKIAEIDVPDVRKFPKREFNHPPDSVMSIIYAKTGLDKETRWNWVSG